MLFLKNIIMPKDKLVIGWFGHQDYEGDDFIIRALNFNINNSAKGFHNPFRILHYGLHGTLKRLMISHATGQDELYRINDIEYHELCRDFVKQTTGCDVVLITEYNPIHPGYLKKIICPKILGFVDDPISTYDRGMQFVGFFDGVVYISPSYIDDMLMNDFLGNFGVKNRYFLPLTSVKTPELNLSLSDICNRQRDAIYVGKSYGPKIDELSRVEKMIPNTIDVYGDWRFGGYHGFVRPLFGGRGYYKHVKKLSIAERTQKYLSTKIGFNMHYTGIGNECGNMRSYESVAHGCMLLSSIGGGGGHELIFKSDEEAVYYKSLSDAADKIKYFLSNPQERSEIAYNGYVRYKAEYTHSVVLKKLVNWIKKTF